VFISVILIYLLEYYIAEMNLSATSLLLMCCAAVLLTATPSSGQQYRPSLAQRLKIARESMFKGLNRKQLEGSESVSSSSSSEPGSVAPLVSTSAVPPVEDQSGASDVVRQLTESYEPEQDDEDTSAAADKDIGTSKEGTLAMEDRERRPVIKPTKYHYYPHNQHLYLLPECATQQVCNAVYTRFNFTQPLCACADRFQGPCSASLQRNDQHTIEVGYKKLRSGVRSYKSPTLVKTCEQTKQIRDCRAPQDWSLLALQNVRTGKSQYLVICRCDNGELDGPMSHDQPAYARVPGIRVYGMMCNTAIRNRRDLLSTDVSTPQFPWEKAAEFATSVTWD